MGFRARTGREYCSPWILLHASALAAPCPCRGSTCNYPIRRKYFKRNLTGFGMVITEEQHVRKKEPVACVPPGIDCMAVCAFVRDNAHASSSRETALTPSRRQRQGRNFFLRPSPAARTSLPLRQSRLPEKEASLGAMTSVLGCAFCFDRSDRLSGAVGRSPEEGAGEKFWPCPCGGGSMRVPPFSPGAAEEKSISYSLALLGGY